MLNVASQVLPTDAEPAFEGSVDALQLENSPAATSRAKRAFDIVVAASLLFLFLPLLLVISVAIRLESKGPSLFYQRRTGLNGKVFRICKLRTMSVQEDAGMLRHAEKGDPRVTRLGGVLRRSSLDELPQLINVLKGEMSIVGPRPHAISHDEHYGGLIRSYASRFRAKPGLTGLAQVEGHRGHIGSIDGMIQRVACDNAYIESWTHGADFRILMRTVPLLITDPNAY